MGLTGVCSMSSQQWEFGTICFTSIYVLQALVSVVLLIGFSALSKKEQMDRDADSACPVQ